MRVTKNPVRACAQGETLEQVKQRFERWRASRKRGQHIPRALWSAAVSLTREHGVERIAQELRINYDRLKQRLESDGAVMRAGGEAARFVELLAPRAVGGCECLVELENARGAKMKMVLKGGDLAGSLA